MKLLNEAFADEVSISAWLSSRKRHLAEKTPALTRRETPCQGLDSHA